MSSPSIVAQWNTCAGHHSQKRSGRLAWALLELQRAGQGGVTPINNPAPRWSGYVHSLRKLGLTIKTHQEVHQGPFPGTHACYELLSVITVLVGV